MHFSWGCLLQAKRSVSPVVLNLCIISQLALKGKEWWEFKVLVIVLCEKLQFVSPLLSFLKVCLESWAFCCIPLVQSFSPCQQFFSLPSNFTLNLVHMEKYFKVKYTKVSFIQYIEYLQFFHLRSKRCVICDSVWVSWGSQMSIHTEPASDYLQAWPLVHWTLQQVPVETTSQKPVKALMKAICIN